MSKYISKAFVYHSPGDVRLEKLKIDCCLTKTMETILSWLKKEKLSLKGFTSSQRYSLATDPQEFFTTETDGLQPVLYTIKSAKGKV